MYLNIILLQTNKHVLAKWGTKDTSDTQCECGAPDQNIAHLLECPTSRKLHVEGFGECYGCRNRRGQVLGPSNLISHTIATKKEEKIFIQVIYSSVFFFWGQL